MARPALLVPVLWLAASCAVEPKETVREEPVRALRPAAPRVPEVEGPPSVASAGAVVTPASTPAPAAPRVYAKTRFVWIREKPAYDSQWIGYLWQGGSVALRNRAPVPGPGCDTWYAVEPRGYVCAGDRRATIDANDPGLAVVRAHAANYDSPTPHHYADSLGAERYRTLPDEVEQRIREPGLAAHLARVETAREGGKVDETILGVDLTQATEEAAPLGELPWQLQISRRAYRKNSAIAYLGEYRHGNRTFLLTSDLAWIPKDRVRPYPSISFHGVHLGKDAKLPLAFFRGHDRPAYRPSKDGRLEVTTETFPRLSHVGLTGRSRYQYPKNYLETERDGLWVAEPDAVVPKPSAYTPWGARVGAPDTKPAKPRGRGTWIESSVYGGYLIAYEDTTPVFVTLSAPGRGGVAIPPQDPTKTSATPVGRFVVTGKYVTATMDAPEDQTHTDVPWVQNFSGPHSIHGAYWHDSWGERVSGGCLNVSPIDGKWLFEFSEPSVPEGWHGLRWSPELEASTVVVIRP